ncbi:UDP-Glycosyltransferase/glycogen phosphorylase [Marasmius fiardii PR-910]|nr:UDP-Glycosyltransferase/glycogen phosphorylase [Marasmius fiardii PR-910]
MNNCTFATAFEALYNSEALTCGSSGRSITGLPRPSLAIVDPFATYAIDTIRSLASPREIPIVSWMPFPIVAASRFFGPDHLGGMGDLTCRIDKEVARTGEDPTKVGVKIFTTVKEEVIKVPGCPPMFDYEWFPQDVDLTNLFLVLHLGRRYFYETEGVLCVTSSAVEREGVGAMREFMNGLGKDFFLAGLSTRTIPEPSPSTDRDGVVAFLDRIYQEHGQKSLIYISFGSISWPTNPASLYAIIDELIQARIPFLFAHGSPRAVVPEQVLSKITSSGVGKEVKWAPQDAVLKHPATGWFLTHGGWNSCQEGLKYKVPLIFWPISADQPANAALITLKHRAGLELICVRTGKNTTKRPYRCDRKPSFTIDAVRDEFRQTLKKIKGEEGRVIRANAEKLSAEISRMWAKDGEAKVEIESFLNKYVDWR